MAISNYLSTKSRIERDKKSQGINPIKAASATFIAFLLVGFIPLFSFVLAAITQNEYLIKSQFYYAFFLLQLHYF